MEVLLSLEAEAKHLVTASDRSYQRSLMEELQKILVEAESLYGPRISAYELREPLMTDCFTAQVVVYPFYFARIYLPRDCRDRRLASYSIAHEAIHLLGPAYGMSATVLEEGLASHFSIQYANRLYGFGWVSTGDPKYNAAMNSVEKLLAKNESVIKELRTRQPVLSKIDENLLVEVAGIERSEAKFLSADFQSYWQEPFLDRATQGAQLFVNGFRSFWNQWKSS